MAEVVDSMGPRNGGEHDWDVLLDGRRRKLVRGRDYDCTEAMMADRVKKAAKRRGVKVSICRSGKHRHVCVKRLGKSAARSVRRPASPERPPTVPSASLGSA